MPVTALLGTKPTRSVPIRSVLRAAKRELDRGNWARALLLLGVVVLVRTGAVVDLPARGVVRPFRGDPPSAD